MRSIWTYLILGVVVLAGLVLRTWNVNFDGGLNAHPDERSNTCFFAPTLGWPSSFDEFLDPELSPLNPLKYRESDFRSYAYGHFPLYLGIITGELLSQLAKPASLLPLPDRIISRMELGNTPCQGMALAGRLLMALLDTLTIFLLFLLGRKTVWRSRRSAGRNFLRLHCPGGPAESLLRYGPLQHNLRCLDRLRRCVDGAGAFLAGRAVRWCGGRAGDLCQIQRLADPGRAFCGGSGRTVAVQASATLCERGRARRPQPLPRHVGRRARSVVAGPCRFCRHQPLRRSRLGKFHPGYTR